jgi:hypothetical protein
VRLLYFILILLLGFLDAVAMLVSDSMSLTPIKQTLVKQTVARYVETKRPPEAVRDLADVGYRVEDDEVVIYSLKTSYADPTVKEEQPIARASYSDDKGSWSVYWSRADMQWHPYEHSPHVTTIDEFVELVSEDKFAKFWG